MKIHTHRKTLVAALLAPALAATAFAAQAQQQAGQAQYQQVQVQGEQPLANWNVGGLYRNTWSADQMIGTDVRGPEGEEIGEVKDIIVGENGRIDRVVVEVGGWLEMGDQHIGVPWRDVRIARNMAFVQVPLNEVESGTYALYGVVPQGEDVIAGPGNWRVNELIGDYADLEDMRRYGLIVDVIFNAQGVAQGVIVERGAGVWGAAGWYGYPYAGYYPGAYAYPLPYYTAEVGDYGRFDYVRFGEQSQYAAQRTTRGPAAAGAGRPAAQPAAQPTGQNLRPWEQQSQRTYDERTRPYQQGQAGQPMQQQQRTQ